ncbi:hypothetical protein FA15DRAFT_659937 [Coprinopsis marcescibilis]|uniref:Uncharacterized protein n=1 Tax=Coprinopsis marcescibilis TaxID=230819 RepID=A0A5C3KGW4_COPMA|nr:hypothetical protein FA15DRAFT_659937 [Coprinopsis marcescibilis]
MTVGHYDNLPNLRLCGLTAWKNSGQLENHETKVMSVRGWMKCVPNMSKEKLVQGLMFECAGDYFNPSVADPQDFEGVWVKTRNFAKHKIHSATKPRLVASVSIIGVTASCLCGLADTRSITGIFVCGSWECFNAFICMLLSSKEVMIAQVVGTMLTFQTRTKDLNAASSGRSKGNTNEDPVLKELEGHTSMYDSPIKTHPFHRGFVPYGLLRTKTG